MRTESPIPEPFSSSGGDAQELAAMRANFGQLDFSDVVLSAEQNEELKALLIQGKQAEDESRFQDALRCYREYLARFKKIQEEQLRDPNFEVWLERELPKQYHEQINILDQYNLLRREKGKREMYICDEQENEYQVPSLEQIKAELRNKFEQYHLKFDQGFKKLLIVPFAVSLAQFQEAVSTQIYTQFKEGKINDAAGQPIDVKVEEPIQVDEPLKDGDLVYYPGSTYHSEDHDTKPEHQARAKPDLLASADQSFSGFHIFLIEDMPNLPEFDDLQEIGGREQIAAGDNAHNYLNMLETDETLSMEQGMCLEDWFTYFMMELAQNNRVVDEWEETSTMESKKFGCRLISTWHETRNLGIDAYWHEGQIVITSTIPWFRGEDSGARTVVPIGK